MTNSEFSTAIDQLAAGGKIDKGVAAQLAFVAQGVDSVPITGPEPSAQQILSDPTAHDFLAQLQNEDASAHRSGSIGTQLADLMLKAVQTYQGTAVEAPGPF